MPSAKLSKTYKPARAQKKKTTKAAVNRSASGWWEKEPKKMRGVKLCERCSAVYFDGHWHTLPALAEIMKKSRRKMAGGETLCKQCQWIVHGTENAKSGFEGQLTLDGLTDLAEKAEILAAVRNFAKRAFERDPEDQIIAIEDRGVRVVVTTSENQLAVGLGKAVDAAFKGGKLRISWSDDDLPARVHWTHKLR